MIQVNVVLFIFISFSSHSLQQTTEVVYTTALDDNGCSALIDGCKTCTNPELQCKTCADGWIVANGTCEKCPDNCEIEACVYNPSVVIGPTVTCGTCRDSYYYDEDANTCEACSGHCSSCDGSGMCSTCQLGYYPNPGVSCSSCWSGCVQCINNTETGCIRCRDGYYLNEANNGNTDVITGSCEACTSHCQQCTSSARCDVCDRGYKRAGASCVSCTSNCQEYSCDIENGCRNCKPGYSLRDGSCKQVKACTHCLECTLHEGCASCEPGYIKNSDGSCTPCPDPEDQEVCETCMRTRKGSVFYHGHCYPCPVDNCKECSNTNPETCNRCVDGYYLDQNRCHECNQTCVTCEGPDIDQCLTCAEGMHLTTTGACVACSSIIAGCTLCTGSTCDQCSEEMYLMDGECCACTSYPSHESEAVCVQCSSGSVPGTYLDVSAGQCAACDSFGDGCTECNDAQCLICAERYSLQNGMCLACNDYGGQCIECNDVECLNCTERYFLRNGGCQACTVSNCLHCTSASSTDCTQCESGYWNNGGVCVQCVANCAVCSDSFTCDQCVAYYVTSQENVLCQACNVENCGDCDANIETCTTCKDGYYPQSNLCLACTVPNCARCSSAGQCDECATKFELNGNMCQACYPQCAECTIGSNNVNTCDRCEDGFFLEFGNCSSQVCGHNCGVCSNGNTCQDCTRGFYMEVGDGCQACASGCGVCSNTDVCTECNEGYGLVGTACVVCHNDCASCDAGANTCDTCKPGFTEKEVCLACPANCEECTTEHTTEPNCSRCMEGYYRNNAGMCAECPANCEECTTEHTTEPDCSRCMEGYYRNDAGMCAVCPNACTTCTAADQCTECIEDHKLVTGQCQLIRVDNCLTEDADDICTACKSGYYLDVCANQCRDCGTASPDDSASVCEQCAGSSGHANVQQWRATCSDCMANCLSCSSANSCTECATGYYYDGQACTNCMANCLSCSSANSCTECATGYYYDGQACTKCPENCESCATNTTCTRCRDMHGWSSALGQCVECEFIKAHRCRSCLSSLGTGQYLTEREYCEACSPSCLQCSNDAITCTSCADTHYLDESRCISCDNAAISQQGCEACQRTYYKFKLWPRYWVGNRCRACSRHCVECDATASCHACAPGYFLFTLDDDVTECFPCMENCLECENLHECITCRPKHYYIDNACRSFIHNGIDCEQHIGCKYCTQTFVLKDDACHRCSALIDNCVDCELVESTNTVECTECLSGYHINGTACSACMIENCANCTGDEDACVECSPDYCYDQTAEVCREVNGANCGQYCEMTEDVLTCVDCAENCVQDTCLRCEVEHCIVCGSDDPNTCTRCADGYHVDSATPTCVPCIDGCLQCTSATEQCTTCASGRYWDATNSVCAECGAGCLECSTSGACLTCRASNAYVDTTNTPHTCEECMSGCSVCTSASVCNECFPDYYGNNSTELGITECIACGENCNRCTATYTNDTSVLGGDEGEGVTVTCESCQHGWGLVDGECVACSPILHCVECADMNNNSVIDLGDCIRCEASYAVNDNGTACLECTFPNCDECWDRELVCDSCYSGNIPSLLKDSCGLPCLFCEDSADCEFASKQNRTERFLEVGCSDGCWTILTTMQNESFYTRGCTPAIGEGWKCENYKDEECTTTGEGEEQITVCAQCCTVDNCNTGKLGNTATAISGSLTTTWLCIIFSWVCFYVDSFI